LTKVHLIMPDRRLVAVRYLSTGNFN